MGLFSKLNFRAVDNAYHVVTCYNFFTHVIVKACDTSDSLEENVNIVSICETVAHETAEALGRVSTKELELQTALQRLAITAQGAINDLTLSGDTQQTAFVVAFLTKRLPPLGDEILKAAKEGYLNGSISDFAYMIDKNMGQITESRARLTERNRKREAAERKAAERKAAEHKAEQKKQNSENYTVGKSNKSSKSSSKITDPLILRCQKCDQSLNVPKEKKLKVSCPTCGHSWVHDGTAGKSESSYPPKDQVAEKVEKGDAEQVTDFADRPKSKLQLREEQARQTPEKEADKTKPDNVTPPPTDVDYVEKASADVVRKLNEEKRIAEEKNQAWAEHEIERVRNNRDELQRVRNMPSVKTSTISSSDADEGTRKTTIKDTKDGSVLWCFNCHKALVIPKNQILEMTCPKCKTSWVHDGTRN